MTNKKLSSDHNQGANHGTVRTCKVVLPNQNETRRERVPAAATTMTGPSRHAVLLVDDDPLLLKAISRVLRAPHRTILSAGSAFDAGALLGQHQVGVILCEPRDPALAAFLIETREQHPDIVRIILTGYPDLTSVLKAVNQAHPFKLLAKPWLDEELIASVALALEQYAINRKRAQLMAEYSGIRATAERSHAYNMLNAVLHSAHADISPDAIASLPVGALLLQNGALTLINSTGQRLLATAGLSVVPADQAIVCLPDALAFALKSTLAAPRRQRSRHSIPGLGNIDCMALEIKAGTLVIFAAMPGAEQPQETTIQRD